MRIPAPLHVAVVVAVALAVARRGANTTQPSSAPIAGLDRSSDNETNSRSEIRVAGVVRSPAQTTPFGHRALLDAGGFKVWVSTESALAAGERVAVTGRLRPPRRSTNPGAPIQGNHEFELTATSLQRYGVESDVRSRVWRWSAATQATWATRIALAIGDNSQPGGAALRGIVTGLRGEVPDGLNERWRACGIFHALSVSGLHLAVVAGIAFWLLRKLVAASPWGGSVRPARWAALPALALAIAYTLITGAQIATLRALCVVAIAFIARALDRPIRLSDALAAAAVVILAVRPNDIFDPSFQLSFIAALTLAVQPHVQPRPQSRLWHWIATSASASLRVAIATAPITAYHFHQVAIGGLIGNLLLTPGLEFVALPLGLIGILAGSAWSELGNLAIRAAAWATSLVDRIAEVLAQVIPLGTVAVASASVMAALVVLSTWIVCTPRRRSTVWLWGFLCLVWTQATATPPDGTLRVTFLDVGQGDAALVELPDGATWLIDAGGLANRPDLASASAPGRTIQRALEAKGRKAIDLAIISHPHPDHYLGLARIAAPVHELWTATPNPDQAGPGAGVGPHSLPSFDAVAQSVGAPIRHPPLGLARTQAGVDVVVWGPRFRATDSGPEQQAADPVRSVNDNSLVVELRFSGRSILFAGDLESEGEANLVAAGLGHVDIVKVAHHGSPTSSSPALIAATHPDIAVISCGVGNTFGFPSSAVIERWRASGANIARTDVRGAVEITISTDGEVAQDSQSAGGLW